MLEPSTYTRAELRSIGRGQPFLWSGVPPPLFGIGRHNGQVPLERLSQVRYRFLVHSKWPTLARRKYPLIFGPWREVRGPYVFVWSLQLAVCAEFRCRGTLIPLPLVFSSQHRQVLEGLVGPTAIAASHDSEQLGLLVLTLTLRTHRRQLEVTGQATLDERCSRCNHALVVALMRMTLIRELQTWTIVHC